MENSNRPINPIFNSDGFCSHDNTVKHSMLLSGLTKREYFAGLAMQGFCSIPNANLKPEEFAKFSIMVADALLKKLENK